MLMWGGALSPASFLRRHRWVRIRLGNNHAADTCLQQGTGARWRAPPMIARFKRNDGGVNPVHQPQARCFGERQGFGMWFSGAAVGSNCENFTTAIQQGATYGRIRVGGPLVFPSIRKGPDKSSQLTLPKCRWPLAVQEVHPYPRSWFDHDAESGRKGIHASADKLPRHCLGSLPSGL